MIKKEWKLDWFLCGVFLDLGEKIFKLTYKPKRMIQWTLTYTAHQIHTTNILADPLKVSLEMHVLPFCEKVARK